MLIIFFQDNMSMLFNSREEEKYYFNIILFLYDV